MVMMWHKGYKISLVNTTSALEVLSPVLLPTCMTLFLCLNLPSAFIRHPLSAAKDQLPVLDSWYCSTNVTLTTIIL